jgi:hypothetical protein
MDNEKYKIQELIDNYKYLNDIGKLKKLLTTLEEEIRVSFINKDIN